MDELSQIWYEVLHGDFGFGIDITNSTVDTRFNTQLFSA